LPTDTINLGSRVCRAVGQRSHNFETWAGRAESIVPSRAPLPSSGVEWDRDLATAPTTIAADTVR